MNATIRRPVTDDLEGVFGVLVASDLDEWGESDLSRAEVLDAWEGLDLSQDCWVATEPDGSIVAYAELRSHGAHDLEAWITVHPNHRRRGLGSGLRGLVEHRAIELTEGAPTGIPVALCGYLNPQRREMVDFAERRGHVRVRRYWRLQLLMSQSPELPVWPDGIRVRASCSGEDDRAVHATEAEAFADRPGSPTVTFEPWIARARIPPFDSSLWLLALDGGVVAGCIRGQAYPDMGWIPSLAVRRPWRGRKLGRGLLLQLLGEFWPRGRARVAGAVTSDGPTLPTTLYQSIGAGVDRINDRYEKVIRAGKAL